MTYIDGDRKAAEIRKILSLSYDILVFRAHQK